MLRVTRHQPEIKYLPSDQLAELLKLGRIYV
jgi:hypothetical protein